MLNRIAVRFQFHKVRLKAFMVLNRIFEPKKFQFHKVRLKDPRIVPFTVVVLFQFHKVRLKDNQNEKVSITFEGFNSIRYD